MPRYTISTTQKKIHERLESLVLLHAHTPYKRPITPVQRIAFDVANAWIKQFPNKQIILDSGCGTGKSTIALAKQNPSALLIGVDRSCDRLSKIRLDSTPENVLFLRANLEDFWRQLHDAHVVISKHYLLHPNPHPKPAQLAKRFHGHPIFPTLLSLSPYLELRSDFRLYLEEFQFAAQRLLPTIKTQLTLFSGEALSAFDLKYQDAQHPFYQLILESDPLR